MDVWIIALEERVGRQQAGSEKTGSPRNIVQFQCEVVQGKRTAEADLINGRQLISIWRGMKLRNEVHKDSLVEKLLPGKVVDLRWRGNGDGDSDQRCRAGERK